jgi:4-amino-4-deoxy-L-arabinose transferase-like glycosyltransferase
MTQPRWSDPKSSTAYSNGADPYEDWYRVPRRADSRREEAAYDEPEEPRDRPARRWGMMPGRFGVCVVIGSAAAGALLTALSNQEPGGVLGVFLVVGAIVAALAVRPRVGYLIIPVPALAYLVTAVIAGLIHDRAVDGSKTALVINAAQWIAGGFVAMSAATLLVIVITAARWRRKSRLLP